MVFPPNHTGESWLPCWGRGMHCCLWLRSHSLVQQLWQRGSLGFPQHTACPVSFPETVYQAAWTWRPYWQSQKDEKAQEGHSHQSTSEKAFYLFWEEECDSPLRKSRLQTLFH